jgi:hypothetical protein
VRNHPSPNEVRELIERELALLEARTSALEEQRASAPTVARGKTAGLGISVGVGEIAFLSAPPGTVSYVFIPAATRANAGQKVQLVKNGEGDAAGVAPVGGKQGAALVGGVERFKLRSAYTELVSCAEQGWLVCSEG